MIRYNGFEAPVQCDWEQVLTNKICFSGDKIPSFEATKQSDSAWVYITDDSDTEIRSMLCATWHVALDIA